MSIDAEEPIDCRELSLNARATWDGDPVPFSLHGDAGELQSGELDTGITWLEVPDWTQDGDLGCFAQIAVWLEPTVAADGTLQVTIEASEDVTSPADSRRDLVLRAEWMSEGIRRD
jgi:hypothetical protein